MVERVITAFDGGVTPFDELSVAEFSPQIELDSANGLTNLRDAQSTTNSGSITESNGQFKLSTGTTASSTAQLDTKEKGRYQPGIQALGGIAIRRPVAPTGNQFWEAGYFDDNNGHWLGEDSTGLYVRMRVGGTDRDKVRPANWSGGNVSINLNRMTIFRFPFLAYYGGPLEIEAILINDNGRPERRLLHSFGPVDGEPIVEQSKLPIRGFVSNGGDASDLSIFVGGRHFSVKGRYAPNRRITSERRLSVSTSTTVAPLISFKKRSPASEQAKSVKINAVRVISDSDSLLEAHLDPNLNGASFNAITDIATAESAMFSDISASSMASAGQILDRWLVSGGQGSQSDSSGISGIGLDIPDDSTVTLAARTISGTGTMTAVFSIEEEW